MKVIAYTALHYGRDYLASAIRSVIDHVDEYHAIYTPVGSHGHRTTVPCPETRDELFAIVAQAAGSKLRWHEGIWPYEGAQRDSIHQYAPDADVIIVLDADEIWPYHLAEAAARGNLDRHKGVSRLRMPMIHYWRSFHKAILHDPAFPERVIYPKSQGGTDTYMVWRVGEDNDPRHGTPIVINHMGYAQRPEIVRYKLETHGHKNEFRRDVNWFDDVFMANRQTDTHLVGSEYWNPETVNPWNYLPEWMKTHKYANLEVIE